MARYNSSAGSTTINGTTTISSPTQGAFTNLTGTAPYTVTLPSPVLFPGTNQTFYNATAGTVTLSTPSGGFSGTGASGTSTNAIFTGNVFSVTSDGTNYVVISEDGSPLIATTGSFSSDVTITGASATVNIQPNSLTLYPGTLGAMDRVAIGANTRSSGAFTTLAANSQVSLTAGTASTSTSSGSLVVTGGVGVTGNIWSGATINASSVVATGLTGTLQTAAQANITSTGDLTAPSLSVTNNVGIGTSSPTGKLDVRTAAGTVAQSNLYTGSNASVVKFNIGQIGSIDWDIGLSASSGNFYIGGLGGSMAEAYRITRTGTAIDFQTWNTGGFERMRIGSSGNVGIGTNSPTSKLELSDASLPVYVIQTRGSLQTILGPTGSDVSNPGQVGTQTNSPFRFVTNNTERARIDSSGNVGIGTLSPLGNLQVSGTTKLLTGGYGQLNVFSTDVIGANKGGKISFGGVSGAAGFDPYGFCSIAGYKDNATASNFSGYLQFSTATSGGNVTERMRIDSSGNVGIGRIDPAYKLDVNGFARMGSYYAGSTNSTVRLAHIFQGPDLPGSFSIVTNDTGTITQKSAQVTTASAVGTTFFFGPYYDLGPGNYQAKFRMKVASNSGSSYMGYIDCVGTNLANTQTVTITPNLFTASNQYQYFNLTFTVTAAGGYVETRWINWQPVTNTSLDHILITPL